jgi:hypothetical protein
VLVCNVLVRVLCDVQHPFLAKADTRKGMKKILSHIFLQNTMEMMNLGGI